MYMFTPLELRTTNSNDTLWKEYSPASPHSCRPLSLILGKETDADLKSVYKYLITEKRASIQSTLLVVLFKDRKFTIKLVFKLSLVDGKMRSLLSGRGGAFCLLCTCTREDARNLELQFSIDISGDQIQDIWRKLTTGELVKRPHDQKVRMGVTQEPLIEFDQISMLSPLHAFMRFFDTLLKIIYHLNAGIFKWSDDKNVLGSSFQLLKNSKDTVKAIIKEKTHLSIDIPDSTGKGGTSTTGNVIHTIMSKECNIQVLVSLVPLRFQEKMHDCISRVYTITKLYNSSHKIDVPTFKDFCFETKRILLESFNDTSNESWVYLTPTVHGLLEHGPELIDANNSEGLGAFTESGLECNNKILRLIRISQSRKCSQIDNLNDCISRLWVRSDLHIRNAVPPKRSLKDKDSYHGFFPLQSLSEYYCKELVID